MTGIDLAADIEINRGLEHVGVRIPLNGHVTQEWLRYYRKLAQEKEVLAEAGDEPDRSWINVRLPATFEPQRLLAMLDAACGLIPVADRLADAPLATAGSEAAIREWWADRRR
jgi:hypothetical protein